MRCLTVAVLLVVVGCGEQPVTEQVDSFQVEGEIQWDESQDEEWQKMKAEEERLKEELKKDTGPVVAKAIEGVREAAANWITSELAESAEITADEESVKAQGDAMWSVAGKYVGEDKEGRKFSAPWLADIEISEGGLNCLSCTLDDRTYLEE